METRHENTRVENHSHRNPAFDTSFETQVHSDQAGRTTFQAWVANAPKQPIALDAVHVGALGAEDVEIAVEHCGLCHSDLSVLNNEWGISQYPATLGHEVVGRVTAVGPNAKGLTVGQ